MRYQGNKKLFKLFISPIYQSTCGYDEGYDKEEPWGYEGEIEGLCMGLTSSDTPVSFYADTKKEVIDYARSLLKEEGFSGKIRLMNK